MLSFGPVLPQNFIGKKKLTSNRCLKARASPIQRIPGGYCRPLRHLCLETSIPHRKDRLKPMVLECITLAQVHLFFRGSCKKSGSCNYEHQVDAEGKPIPVGPAFLQRCDEAVKRFNDNKAQNKAKIVPKGGVGVSSSMVIVDQEEDEASVTCSAIHISEDC